jgi:hypothetical protein
MKKEWRKSIEASDHGTDRASWSERDGLTPHFDQHESWWNNKRKIGWAAACRSGKTGLVILTTAFLESQSILSLTKIIERITKIYDIK